MTEVKIEDGYVVYYIEPKEDEKFYICAGPNKEHIVIREVDGEEQIFDVGVQDWVKGYNLDYFTKKTEVTETTRYSLPTFEKMLEEENLIQVFEIKVSDFISLDQVEQKYFVNENYESNMIYEYFDEGIKKVFCPCRYLLHAWILGYQNRMKDEI